MPLIKFPPNWFSLTTRFSTVIHIPRVYFSNSCGENFQSIKFLSVYYSRSLNWFSIFRFARSLKNSVLFKFVLILTRRNKCNERVGESEGETEESVGCAIEKFHISQAKRKILMFSLLIDDRKWDNNMCREVVHSPFHILISFSLQ